MALSLALAFSPGQVIQVDTQDETQLWEFSSSPTKRAAAAALAACSADEPKATKRQLDYSPCQGDGADVSTSASFSPSAEDKARLSIHFDDTLKDDESWYVDVAVTDPYEVVEEIIDEVVETATQGWQDHTDDDDVRAADSEALLSMLDVPLEEQKNFMPGLDEFDPLMSKAGVTTPPADQAELPDEPDEITVMDDLGKHLSKFLSFGSRSSPVVQQMAECRLKKAWEVGWDLHDNCISVYNDIMDQAYTKGAIYVKPTCLF